jgi:hypothetical protein
MLLLCTVGLRVMAQTTKTKAPTKNRNTGLSAGIMIPVGHFSSTHFAGISAEYSPARHDFGLTQLKKWTFTYNGGIAYYFGKKEIVNNYPYRYPGYLFIHAFGGLLYHAFQHAGLSLTAGPALGLYNGNTRFNFGSKLEAVYFLNPKWGIGPGIIGMKESGADAIWSVSLKTTLVL